MPLMKNQSVILEITGVTAEGSGVGRYTEEESAGIAVFVPFTAVGDRIRCKILKVQKNHAYGKMEELLTASPDRCPAGSESHHCDAFGKCGGCTWRHVTYEAELRYKRQRVEDALRRIGGMDVVPEPIVPCEAADHYRNKAQFPISAGEHGPLIGFYAPRSHRIIEQHDCKLQPENFKTILDIVAQWVQETGVALYDETARKGLLRHIYLRQAEATGQVMVCLVCTSGKLPGTKELVRNLRTAVPGLASVMVNLNREDTNVVLGEHGFTLWGTEYIVDELCGLRFRLSPRSFYQVNRRQAEKLYEIAGQLAHLTGNETLLDLYCGTGTIGLSMAKKAGMVIGVEVVAQAVEDARRNAEDNGIRNVRFLCADAGQAAFRLKAEGVKPDVVVIDPPRKGCSPEVITTIVEMAPERVVYVSCDPATLARDLKIFTGKGYTLQSVRPVDMFPRTPHVETVVLMSRRGEKDYAED